MDDLWQADLLEMIPFASVNRNYKYILVVIDVFSRYAWAVAMRKKDAAATTEAFEEIITKHAKGRSPTNLQTDAGKEFYNSSFKKHILQKYNIHHYSVYSRQKCAIVERLNRTLRQKLMRYFTYTGRKVWYNILTNIMSTYNKTKHSALFHEMAPCDVNDKNESNIWQKRQVTTSAKSNTIVIANDKTIKLGNYCRVSVAKVMKKNFSQNWSEEIFQIVGRDTKQFPVMYYLQDLNGKHIKGRFYKEEIQDIGSVLPNIHRIAKILKTVGSGKHKRHLVKWTDNSFKDSWIKASEHV